MENMSVKALRAAMILQDVGVTELARRAKIQTNLVSIWLKREKVSVRLSTLGKISKALHIPADELLCSEISEV